MAKKRYIFLFLIVPILLTAKGDQKISLQKASIKSAKYFDINRIKSSIRNDGIFARHPITGNADFYFDGEQLIYTSGLWIAAKVNGEIRASASDFLTDFIGGAIDGQGNPYGKEDSTFRVYKICRGDNASNNPDYAEWPIELGAPSDGQGNPLLIGDQTLWCSFTDSYFKEREYNICTQLGAEIHQTIWGWQTIENVMFIHWEIINKSKEVWNDTYFGIFSDPDITNGNNDLIGSDSTLHLVYCYDSLIRQIFLPNHALGYQLLASPIVPLPGDTAYTIWGKKLDYKNVLVYYLTL
jgi:hypothetical protein